MSTRSDVALSIYTQLVLAAESDAGSRFALNDRNLDALVERAYVYADAFLGGARKFPRKKTAKELAP